MQKKGGADLEDIEWQDSFLSNNDASFPNDPTGELPNSWGAAVPSAFQIRGETYLKDRKKVKILLIFVHSFHKVFKHCNVNLVNFFAFRLGEKIH